MKYIDIIIKIAEINDKIVLIDCDLAKCFEEMVLNLPMKVGEIRK